MGDIAYEKKLQEQIEQYRATVNVHDLPGIFHYWMNKHIRPRVNEVLGVDSVANLYADHFAGRLRRTKARTVLSIGCGDCSVEIDVARTLLKLGVTDFVLEGIEVSPHLLGRASEKIRELNLQGHFRLVEVDVNSWTPETNYVGVMAHHSLHHIVRLEELFANVARFLTPDGVFVTNDVIGRNGHMRWPEAAEVVESLWKVIPQRYKYNWQKKRVEEEFINFDCSVEGFEGIRAQDILPLLVERFGFEKFLAYGNLPDVFVDRDFGHNLNPDSEEDRLFIDVLEVMNTVMINSGYLKPTQMYAVMSKGDVKNTSMYKNWSPRFCVRSFQ